MCKSEHLKPIDLKVGKNEQYYIDLMEWGKKKIITMSMIPRHYIEPIKNVKK